MSAAPLQAQSTIDRVRRHNGVDSGKITAITPLEITISKGGVESTIPAEDVVSVTLAGEPSSLNSARNALLAGRPQEALDQLEKMSLDGVTREEILADAEFYTTLANAQLALAGTGDATAIAADVRGFMTRRPKSFHIPQCLELLGDLLAAAGDYPAARTEYAKLAKAKSPYYELQSALLVGRAWQAEGDHAKALAEFDKVVAATTDDPLIASIKLAATLDRAVSQAAAGKVEESAAAIGQIIAQADPEDAKLLSRAYNALGDCYLKSGDQRAALYAFLHVDLLYNTVPEAHAKALHELVALWKSTGRVNRSQETAQKLTEKYPNSRWTKP